MSVNPIIIIAKNEFNKILDHPIVLTISCILFIMAILNGAGSSYLLGTMEKSHAGQDVFISIGLPQILYYSSIFCTIVAVFVGVMAIPADRFKNSLNVLLTKPVYRRDIILGKFIGINAFIFVLISVNLVVCSLIMMVYFRPPIYYDQFMIRLFFYILALFFECSLTTCITLFIGIIFNDILLSLILAISYFFIVWYSYFTQYTGSLSILSPQYLYYTIIDGNFNASLFDTSIPVIDWLNASLPFIALILVEIILMLVLTCFIFVKKDEV